MPTLLLGGTFDPPHLGHLVLGECARVQVGAERAVWLVAGDPWRKSAKGKGERGKAPPPRDVTPASGRLAMVRLAVEGNAAFVVDDREVRRAGPTYTVDTLRELRAEGAGELVLVLGADALADMPNWKEPAAIGELARIIVAHKPSGPLAPGDAAGLAALARAAGLAYTPEVVDMPPIALSSTAIRARVAAGKPIRYLVPEGVERYIRGHRLYRASTED